MLSFYHCQMKIYTITCLLFAALLPGYYAFTQNIKIVTNQVGYDLNEVKHAVIVAEHADSIGSFQLLDKNGKQVFSGKVVYTGPVDQWKNWAFYTIDFTPVTVKGRYTLQVNDGGKTITSYPFVIDKDVLEQYTLSGIIYYFKGQRSSGLFDKADAHIHFEGKKDSSTVDVHGGW